MTNKAIKYVQMTVGDGFIDGCGGEFPDALIAINNVGIDSHQLLKADFEDGIYKCRGAEIKKLVYSVNFWYKTNLRTEGWPPRPLITRDKQAVFEVNMDDYIGVYDEFPSENHEESILAVCERHFRQEVLPLLKV
jgi:hypothetical protein